MNMVQLTSFDTFTKQLIDCGGDESAVKNAGFIHALSALQKHGLQAPKMKNGNTFLCQHCLSSHIFLHQ